MFAIKTLSILLNTIILYYLFYVNSFFNFGKYIFFLKYDHIIFKSKLIVVLLINIINYILLYSLFSFFKYSVLI